MQLSCARASLQDADFIISLIMAGARKGHFYPNLANDKAMLRNTVISTIRHGVQDESGLRSEAMVGWVGSTRIGVTIVTETERTDNSIEIAAIAVKKQFQGSGYGGQLLDALLVQWSARNNLYARCFPSSEHLYQMLLRRGFAEVSTTGAGTRVLRRERELQPDHGGGMPIFHATPI